MLNRLTWTLTGLKQQNGARAVGKSSQGPAVPSGRSLALRTAGANNDLTCIPLAAQAINLSSPRAGVGAFNLGDDNGSRFEDDDVELFSAHDFPNKSYPGQRWNLNGASTAHHNSNNSTVDATSELWYGGRQELPDHPSEQVRASMDSTGLVFPGEAGPSNHRTEVIQHVDNEPAVASTWNPKLPDNIEQGQRRLLAGSRLFNVQNTTAQTASATRKGQFIGHEAHAISGSGSGNSIHQYHSGCDREHHKLPRTADLNPSSSPLLSSVWSSSSSSPGTMQVTSPACHLPHEQSPSQASLQASPSDTLREHGIDLAQLLSQVTPHLRKQPSSMASTRQIQPLSPPSQVDLNMSRPCSRCCEHSTANGDRHVGVPPREAGSRVTKVVVIFLQD